MSCVFITLFMTGNYPLSQVLLAGVPGGFSRGSLVSAHIKYRLVIDLGYTLEPPNIRKNRCNSGFISCNNLKFQLTPFEKTKIFDIYIFVLAMPLLLKRVLKPPHPDLCRQYPITRSVSSQRTIRTETQRKTQTGLQGSFPLGEMLLDLNSCRIYS